MLMGLVYVQLRIQLQHDGEVSLKSEKVEVQDVGRDDTSGSSLNRNIELSDDRGQNVYFVVTDANTVVFQSSDAPLPVHLLQTHANHQTFAEFENRQTPYRLLQYSWHFQNKTYQVFIYKLISQEFETLRRVRHLMLVAGALGIAMTVTINLWIANRALAPARRTWQAHQDMMLELSHELQTPLATIQAVVSSNSVDDRLRSNVLIEVQYASSMVKDILYLTDLRTRIPGQPNEPVAVSDLTEEVVERFHDLAASRGIELQGCATSGLFVNTTSERWSRLISTLIKNVVDHAVPHTTPKWALKSNNNRVEFMVVNQLPSLNQQSRTKPARGLGLVIADRLVRDMGGTMQLLQRDGSLTTIIRVPQLNPHD